MHFTYQAYLYTLCVFLNLILVFSACPEDFDDHHGVALLTSFEDIHLLEHVIDYNFFAVVIDCFDEIAKKPVIRKLYGDFHIGLTTRNFYVSH